MKKLFRPLVCFVFVFLLTSETAFAITFNRRAYETELGDMLEFIATYYAGDLIDLDDIHMGAIEGMFSVLDDYSEFMDVADYEEFSGNLVSEIVGIGVTINSTGAITIVDVFDGSPAQAAGIQVGDVIQKVDGIDVTGAAEKANISSYIQGEEGTQVTLEIIRGDQTLEITATRAVIHVSNVTAYTLDEVLEDIPEGQDHSHIRYIMISSFDTEVASDFEKITKKLQADGVTHIILDLRDNTGGLTDQSVGIAQMLVPKGPIAHVIHGDGERETYSSLLEEAPFSIAVLTNHYTASASELLTGALQDSGVGVVIGDTTFGKGVGQIMFSYNQSKALKLTISEFYTPKFNKINNVGIKPDIAVPTPKFVYNDYGIINKYSQAEDINSVIEGLNYLGYPAGDVNGVYTDSLKEAIKSFQRDNSLDIIGQVDFDTMYAINSKLINKIWSEDEALYAAYEWMMQ